jgi:hypothetical protein
MKHTNKNLSLCPSLEDYKSTLSQYAVLLNNFGIERVAYDFGDLRYYSRLSLPKQTAILEALHASCEALRIEASFTKDINEISNSRMFWNFCLRMGFGPRDEIMDTIDKEVFIQVYDRNNMQLYRSLGCFRRCSFTVAQMTSRPWFDLWDRESFYFHALKNVGSFLMGLPKVIHLSMELPFHKVAEVNSTFSYSFDYRVRTINTISRAGTPQAAVFFEDWRY